MATKPKRAWVQLGSKVARDLRDRLNHRAIDEGVDAQKIVTRALERELAMTPNRETQPLATAS